MYTVRIGGESRWMLYDFGTVALDSTMYQL